MLRRGRSLVLVYTIAFSILMTIALLTVLPISHSYYALDGGSRGHSELSKMVSTWLTTLRVLQEVESAKTLLVIAREEPLALDELEHVVGFVKRGSVVVFYGSENAVKQLFEYLGFRAEYLGSVIDPVFSASESHLVLVNVSSLNATLLLDSPYAIQLAGYSEEVVVEPMAYTSMFSYVDSNSNSLYDIGEPIDSFPVVYSIRLGYGKLIVVCAHGLFTNNVFNSNVDWLKSLASEGDVLLDQSWVKASWLLYLKLLMNTPRTISPLYISLLVVAVVLVSTYVYNAIYR